MHILVLQHLAVEHPGTLRDFLQEDGVTWETVELDAGETIPALARFDMMWVMGGPQDVWQTTEFPWLVDEIAAIRTFVTQLRRPYLGLCLGHQLLAAALGGEVGLAREGEVGLMDVKLSEQGRRDRLLQGMPDPLPVLQWHGAEVKSVPSDVAVLASSERCAIQAIRYGACAYGLQFHAEVTATTVADWAAIPAYAQALDRALGSGAAARLEADVAAKLSNFNAVARTLYRNLMQASAQPAT
ncbi:MAG: type 1 glutamine amidotransferase [Hyphomicrobiaceae bacterium]